MSGNPYHDEKGRFSEGPGGTGMSQARAREIYKRGGDIQAESYADHIYRARLAELDRSAAKAAKARQVGGGRAKMAKNSQPGPQTKNVHAPVMSEARAREIYRSGGDIQAQSYADRIYRARLAAIGIKR